MSYRHSDHTGSHKPRTPRLLSAKEWAAGRLLPWAAQGAMLAFAGLVLAAAAAPVQAVVSLAVTGLAVKAAETASYRLRLARAKPGKEPQSFDLSRPQDRRAFAWMDFGAAHPHFAEDLKQASAEAGLKGLPRLLVIDDKDITLLTVRARSKMTGQIENLLYVSTGSFQRLDRNELKTAVMHEFGHIARRHGLKGIIHERLGKTNAVLGAVAFASLGGWAPVAAGLIYGAASHGLSRILESALMRRDETEADRFAVLKTARLDSFVSTMEKLDTTDQKLWQGLLENDTRRLRTAWSRLTLNHPFNSARIQDARNFARKTGLQP